MSWSIPQPLSAFYSETGQLHGLRNRSILARKSALFASYIRPSAMKDATPAAVDSTVASPSQSTQQEHIIELERRRLRLAA